MNMIGQILAFFICYIIGVFGFTQIVGSLQNIKNRGIPMTLFTISVWTIIVGLTVFIIYSKFNNCMVPCVIAMIISFLQTLFAGKIE